MVTKIFVLMNHLKLHQIIQTYLKIVVRTFEEKKTSRILWKMILRYFSLFYQKLYFFKSKLNGLSKNYLFIVHMLVSNKYMHFRCKMFKIKLKSNWQWSEFIKDIKIIWNRQNLKLFKSDLDNYFMIKRTLCFPLLL